MSQICVPVLLGSDINAYGMARSFHERYGITSYALAEFPLTTTRDSDIVDVTIVENFAEDAVFVSTLEAFAETVRARAGVDTSTPLVLVACGDTYASLVSLHKEQLSKSYVVQYIEHDLLARLTNKAQFSAICDEHGLDHPKTLVVTYDEYAAGAPIDPDFGFPMAVKPADSVEYLTVDFKGRKKAYVVASQRELMEVIARIYEAGYRSEMIVQDFVPGDDSKMRVLNAYVGSDHSVRMLCLGHPLLEDYAPATIGNYTVIMSEGVQQVYDQVRTFLESIEYTGFANFDMKFDERDGTYRFFELNPRQGRSSFYVTLAGYNLAEYLVEDAVEHAARPLVTAQNEVVWLGVPEGVFKKYATDGPAKDKALALIKQGKVGTTLFYDRDRNLTRLYRMLKLYARYYLTYRKYFGHRGLDS